MRGSVDGLIVVAAMAALMWVVEVIDAIDHHALDSNGIHPRDVDGLAGIVAAPFLHASWAHLIGNTIPFLAMGFVIALNGALRVAAVTAIVALVSGLGTWLIGGDHTNHIGSSGIVFGYATYLMARGIYNRHLLELAVGVVVVVLFAGALLGGLEPQQGISWQGHLFGAIGGVVAARALARDRPAGRGRGHTDFPRRLEVG
jgi:membrane associated rhomboid family serine protease